MKKILIGFFLLMLCLLLGFAAWFSFSFNAVAYRERIIKNLSQMTGRSVEISGPVSLTWTPFPTLVISNLTLANQEKSESPLMLSVERIQAEIEWGSLFKEPLVVKKVVLEKPVLLLERIRKYETNFNFPVLFKTTQNIDPSFLNGQNDFSLSINEVEVKEGVFTYHNIVSGEKMTLNGVTGTGSVSSLEGPFSFNGNFLVADKPKKVELTIGKIELSQSLPVTVYLTDVFSKTTIKSSGMIVQDAEKAEEWLNLSGVIGSENASLFFQNMGVSHWPNGGLVGSFTLKVMTDRTVFDSITVRQGEGDAETSFFLGEQLDEESQKKIPTLVVKNIDYEKWKDLLWSVPKLGILDKVNTDFRIQVEEAKINQNSLTQGVAKGHIENGVFSFSHLTAQLPFDSSFGLTGTWIPKTEKWDAEVQFQSADLRSFVEWLSGKKLDFLPQQGLKNAQLMGKIQWDSNQINANISAGVLDETEFSGKVDVLMTDRQKISAALEMKKLNLNQYVQWTLQNLKDGILSAIDVDFDIQAQDLTVDKFLFKQLNTKGTLKDKKLSLREFFATGENNVVLNLTAEVENLGTENLFIQTSRTNFEIPNLSTFNLLSNTPFKEMVSAKGNITYVGQFEKGTMQADLILNQAKIKVNGVVENLLDNAKFSETTFSLKHENIQDFLNPFKTAQKLLPHLSGKIEISFQGNGTMDGFFAKNFSFSGGKSSLKGEMRWDLNQKYIQAHWIAPELDLDQFLPSFEEIKKMAFEPEISPDWQMDLALSSDAITYRNENYTALNTKFALKNQNLTISSFDLATADKKGNLSLTAKAILKNPIIVEGKLNLDKMPVKNLYKTDAFTLENGTITLAGNFIASGSSWAGFTQSLRADGKVFWKNGLMRGIDMNELSVATEKSLKQYQPISATQPLIKHALANGTSNMLSGVGAFQAEQGELKFSEFTLSNNFGNIFMRAVKWPFLTQKVSASLAIILNTGKNLPSLDLQLQNGQLITQSEVFEKALEQESKLLEKQNLANQEKQEQQRAEEKRNEILTQADEILSFSEEQIKQMKDASALRSSAEGGELMSRAMETLDEVRSLAVRSDLNGEQLTVLQEKANLLNIRAKELKNFLARQDVLRQREAVQKLPPLVKIRITELIQLYNQNSQSSVMAGLVQGSQKEEEKINRHLTLLTKAEDLDTATILIDEVKSSFQKIQKALNYARQLDLAGGFLPQGE